MSKGVNACKMQCSLSRCENHRSAPLVRSSVRSSIGKWHCSVSCIVAAKKMLSSLSWCEFYYIAPLVGDGVGRRQCSVSGCECQQNAVFKVIAQISPQRTSGKEYHRQMVLYCQCF
eukprot:285437-Pelagomonas_calceolata.AAC.1